MKTPIIFPTADESHNHSLETLNDLYRYDDFMLSITNVLDVGCGSALDLEWWASRYTRDADAPEPLNIKCTGIDLFEDIDLPNHYEAQKEINYTTISMEDEWILDHMDYKRLDRRYDVIWCHDAFQYSLNPLVTLSNFYKLLSLVVCYV